jgi:hypothetical protein
MNVKFIMCNMSWMKRYEGITADDHPINGGEYIEINGHGHEVLNYKRIGKYVYGHVQAKNLSINIDRIGADGADYIDGVDVVWRAKSRRGSVVVGWYRNARVFREEQKAGPGRIYGFKGETHEPGYLIRARFSDAVLLPPVSRVFRVPVTHKGFGSQTFVTYLQEQIPEVVKFKEDLADFMARVENGERIPVAKGKRGPIDVERRLSVERAAIEAAVEYYLQLGYNVKSVESENVGYDLLVESEDEELYVEVKGTSVKHLMAASVMLTPNEYSTSKKQRAQYRIILVIDALENPEVIEFAWLSKQKQWVSEEALVQMNVQEMTAASMRVTLLPRK